MFIQHSTVPVGVQNTHVSDGQQSFVKEQDHPKEEEKYTKAC